MEILLSTCTPGLDKVVKLWYNRGYMNKIFNSASKIVFVLMALASVALASLKIMDVKDFVILATMSFSFYFTKSTPTPSSTE